MCEEASDFRAARITKLKLIREMGLDPYAIKFNATHEIGRVVEKYRDVSDFPEESVEEAAVQGRLTAVRSHGKTFFCDLRDGTGQIQLYFRKNLLSEDDFKLLKLLDTGDFIGVHGSVFRTRMGELSIKADKLTLLSKSLHPLPEKWHGLKDVELRYRKRYLDLLMNEDVRETFRKRSKIIRLTRAFMERSGFTEVETPMMQPIAGGAKARAFETHHNALDIPLYLRIAPELYLKRLIVGGMDRVYEINRSFRNEGISTRHNPEFTMLEFYWAYADYRDLMEFTEEMVDYLLEEMGFAERVLEYGGKKIDFKRPWRRVTYYESLAEALDVAQDKLHDEQFVIEICKRRDLDLDPKETHIQRVNRLFEAVVEQGLVNPTFVTDYPVETAPLAKRLPENPNLAARFEFFVGGIEIANAYCELNDPVDQRARFEDQLKIRDLGDEEAHKMDEDYISALEYGMPPTAGEGIGIDRLVMILTGVASIRDAILFPLLRPQQS